ncbi:MAG: hypothetical protein Q7V62_09970, partial [Actinomycetota bacterium]|nr:hypothetical protein [Actinomycetota bacterium]
NGYGHDECPDRSGNRRDDSENGALLVRLLANGTTLRYRFPDTVLVDDTTRTVRNVFPLALNDTRAILRGDISIGRQSYGKRLLSCVINPAALDAGGDGTVDCSGGMTVVGGIADSIRVGTVLGFSMNNAGVLAGNLGYNEAGTGTPFVVDVTAATPEPVLIGNLASSTDSWEINTITDMNLSGRMVGYGYKNCGDHPEAFYIEPAATAPASALRFGRGAFEVPGFLVADNAPLAITPTIDGGSGNYEFRVYTRTPTDSDWALLSDWSAVTAPYAPGDYRGDVCFRIDARDTGAPDAVQRTVVRYAVIGSVPSAPAGEDTPDGDESGTADVAASTDSFRITDLLGAAGGLLLAALGVLGLRRRTRR